MHIWRDEGPGRGIRAAEMMQKFKMKTSKVPSTREIVRKPKPASPDFWAFLVSQRLERIYFRFQFSRNGCVVLTQFLGVDRRK